ncbi:Transmembrane emp24-like trafficking protein 10 precursor [Oopsacas minuta]|uniref:Transmembrane emp24-like trafficking protein 10 n=1 Tax=Oopsacas minuta TaxID=111878 RepID=A0AAV7KKS8_9METZ|nr:Transmembrane emp24-like trafficking protein 10 precursor [Oopsacas minuta]
MLYKHILAIHLALILITLTQSINFYITSGVKKCLQEEVHKNDIVSGEYHIYQQQEVNIPVKVIVTDERDQTLYTKEEATEGKFGFTIDYYGPYTICFHSLPSPFDVQITLRVELNLKHGVDSKDYKDTIEAEQLKPLEAQLRRLEDLSNEIVQDFAYMRKREEEMRDTNESTNTRVLYFSVFSMICLLSLAVWQLFYLRRYFKAKKLID